MYLTQEEINQLLAKEDLSKNSNHAIGILTNQLKNTLEKHYQEKVNIEYGNPIVTLHDNYYALNYAPDEITLGSRYTKYINKNTILRTQMSSTIPSLLRNYKKNELQNNQLWMCPGIVYRRDVRDKTHVGEPHQCDIWYLTKETKTREDLLELVGLIISLIEKNTGQKIKWRYNETNHNYTDNGIEVEIYYQQQWLEILECGLISQQLLKNHQLEDYSGLALGLGLERLVMLIKGISDIRTLYSQENAIQEQLKNLKKYKEVSKQPSIKRDLSIAVSEQMIVEELTEKLWTHIDSQLTSQIESLSLVKEYSYHDLPEIAKERLGMKVEHKNMLIRVILRDLARTLTNEEANTIYTTIYEILHEGSKGYKVN